MQIRFVLLLFIAFEIIHCVSLTSMSQTLPMLGKPSVNGVTIYNPGIPEPQNILGYVIGEKHTYPHLINEYFSAVARASDRVILESHGKTYEGRALIHAIITSPSNHNRLENIREANLMLSADPSVVNDEFFRDAPLVVWMGYGVHGNEASSFEAALLLLYHLSAGEGPDIEEFLENLIIILVPSLNPDGHMRFVHWVNSNRGGIPVADPQHREHNEPWPGGRTNYYWSDLNRDWFPLQHPESRGRIELYNRWRPQVLADYHEMGSDATYFFQPGISTRYNPNIPTGSRTLLEHIGRFHAAALDKQGVLYYSGEIFDDFYIGKGSTYPMVTGAVGILFEQASSRALKRETEHGTIEFHETILNQFTTSLSTLDACIQSREELLRNQRDFYMSGSRVAAESDVRAYLISQGEDRARFDIFVDILLRHRIKVYRLLHDISVSGKEYRAGNAIVIPIDQPEVRLIKAAMERYTEFEDSLFYDISSWTLPLAFNLKYTEFTRNPANLLGEEITSLETATARMQGGRASYAYVVPWQNYYAPKALYRLQSNGIRTYLATRNFVFSRDGTHIPMERGAILVPVVQRGIQPDHIHRTIESVITDDGIDVYALDSGSTAEGPDLGSPSFKILHKPTIALFVGQGVSAGEAGEVWHLLNEKMNIPITLLDINRVPQYDLSRYNTLIMVNGMYDRLPDSVLKRVEERVVSGAVLITTKNASRYVIENGVAEGTVLQHDPDTLDVPYENIPDIRGAQRIGGIILRVDVDNTHPLAFGFNSNAFVFRNHDNVFGRVSAVGSNVLVYSDDPLVSGYISEQKLREVKQSASLWIQRKGNGRIVLFADNPNFRSFWYGTNKFFLNSIFFGMTY
jgi:hypothetical protein